MKKRPKNKNKTKLKGAEASKSAPVVQVATQLGVHRSILEKQLLDYVAEMRKNRKLCVTTKCLILMMAKFDPAGTPHHPQRQQNQKRNAGGCGLVC
ncbi:hypothetical protein PC128_g26052 [Phytophthora cactorum]|nr:hypothetical protein PC128_g26052 [Phytophthora cactorum]